MKIVNIVATVILREPLDLHWVHQHLPGSKFPKSGAPWLQYRIKPENYYTTFYKSGKFLITGITSPVEINPLANRIIGILKDHDVIVEIAAIKIHNYVVIDSIGHEIQFDKLITALRNDNIEYEPEQFPGMIIREGEYTFLVFSSGKIILTGIKDIDDIEPILEKFKQKLAHHG